MAKNRTISKSATPVARTTLGASAFQQMASYVITGRWKEGEKLLPERKLCLQLGIARTSLREALKAMEMIGMLDSRQGDGTFVRPRSEFLSQPLLWAFQAHNMSEFGDLVETRIVLEEYLAGLAAERGSDAEIERIGVAVQTMRDKLAEGDDSLEYDIAFHLAVAAAAHNQGLTNAVQLLGNLIRTLFFNGPSFPLAAEMALARHKTIYDAIARRSPADARQAMRDHLKEAAAAMFGIGLNNGLASG